MATKQLIVAGSCHKYHFSPDKIMFVATFCFVFCRGKDLFVATKTYFCRDKHVLVATKMIIVAAPANGRNLPYSETLR